MEQPADPPSPTPPPLRTFPPPLPTPPPPPSFERELKRLPAGMKLIVGALMAVTATMGVVGGKAFVRRLVHSRAGATRSS